MDSNLWGIISIILVFLGLLFLKRLIILFDLLSKIDVPIIAISLFEISNSKFTQSEISPILIEIPLKSRFLKFWDTSRERFSDLDSKSL